MQPDNCIDSNLLFAYQKVKKTLATSHHEGIELLDSILRNINTECKWSDFYQEVVYTKHKNDFLKDDLSIPKMDYYIDSLINDSTNLVSVIDLLVKKMDALKARSEIEYAISTGLYAEYLRSKLSINYRDKPYFRPFSVLATVYDGEQLIPQAKFFYKKSKTSSSKETSGYRFVSYFGETIDKKIDLDYYKDLCNRYIDSSNIDHPYNTIIHSDILTKVDDKLSIHLAQSYLSSIDDYCIENAFYEITYLIDSFIRLKRTREAQEWINTLESCPLEGIKKFLLEFRKMDLLISKNSLIQSEIKDLEILKKQTELIDIYSNYGANVINKHFADVIYRCNNNAMKAIYSLIHRNQSGKHKNLILNQLNQFKILYDKISDSGSMLAGNVIPDGFIEKYNKHLIKLENLEVDAGQYLDTTMTNYSVYEKIYDQHRKLYALKNTLKKDTSYRLSDSYISSHFNIKPNQKIIDILRTEEWYYFTSITDENIDVRKESIDQVDNFLDLLLQSVKSKKEILIPKNFEQLFDQLALNDKKEIVIIPDGKFYEVPFEMIVNKLQEDNISQISYSYNLKNALGHETTKVSPSISTFSFSNDESLNDNTVKQIPELKLGFQESKSVCALYDKCSIYAGKAFTQEKVYSNTGNIIHFSSHGFSDPEYSLKNFLYCRTSDANIKKLYGFEIKNENFTNKLILLSSCNSGTGVQKPGTGVFSLSRDFLQAGAQTVVKSLWAVNERSTKMLMEEMHKNFTSGQSIGESLSNAKRTVKKMPGYEHPYYWAGFVLEGNPHVYLDLEN